MILNYVHFNKEKSNHENNKQIVKKHQVISWTFNQIKWSYRRVPEQTKIHIKLNLSLTIHSCLRDVVANSGQGRLNEHVWEPIWTFEKSIQGFRFAILCQSTVRLSTYEGANTSFNLIMEENEIAEWLIFQRKEIKQGK